MVRNWVNVAWNLTVSFLTNTCKLFNFFFSKQKFTVSVQLGIFLLESEFWGFYLSATLTLKPIQKVFLSTF